MSFDLEKIMNVSLIDYCDSVGKKPRDYKLVGVSAYGRVGQRNIDPSIKTRFAENVPFEAEAVVNYQVEFATISKRDSRDTRQVLYEANGVALIPKEEEKLTND
jgi:hypothetical protein